MSLFLLDGDGECFEAHGLHEWCSLSRWDPRVTKLKSCKSPVLVDAGDNGDID
jgi:hypothetical protein